MPKKRENQNKSKKLSLTQWLSNPCPNSPRAAKSLQINCPSEPPLVSVTTVGSELFTQVDTIGSIAAVDLSPSLTARDRFILPAPGAASGSLVEEARLLRTPSRENRVLLVEVHSRDPIGDFRHSMVEMMGEYGVGKGEPLDWEVLERLLQAYLEVNEKEAYRYIFAAFFDLTVEMGLGLRREGC